MSKKGQTFTPISQLFVKAFHKIKPPIRHLLGIEVLEIIVATILVIILAVNFGTSIGIATAEYQNLSTEQEVVAYFSKLLLNPETLLTTSLFALIGTILFSISTAFFTAALLIRLDRSHTGFPFKQLLKEAAERTPAAFFTMIVVAVLAIGSIGLFVIPGLLVSALLAFVIYEVVLEKVSLPKALRNSYAITTTHFFTLLLRAIVLIVGMVIVFFILDVIAKNSGELRTIVELITSVIAVVINWIALAYVLIMYREARAATPLKTTKNPIWIYVISAIGWVALLLIGSAIWSFSGPFIEEYGSSMTTLFQQFIADPAFLEEFETLSPDEQLLYLESLTDEAATGSAEVDTQ